MGTITQLAVAIEYANCIFPTAMNVLYLALNHQMVRLQSYSFGNVEYFFIVIIPSSNLIHSTN